MASFPPRKLESNTGRDLISELPVDLKERILECLPTRDVARTALLSTHWNDVWLRHGRLVFDSGFFQYFGAKLNTINNLLLHRAGRVRKFTLHIDGTFDPWPEQSDIDRWCLFLSRNGVEELNLSLYSAMQYKLPVCIFSCRTIKQLKLVGFLIYWPLNAGKILPGITSLYFKNVEFKCGVNGIASGIPNLPNLEKLTFRHYIRGIDNFEISAPKLENLYATCFVRGHGMVESRWFPLHLKTIKSLSLSGFSLGCEDVATAVSMFPTAINLQVMKLYDLSINCGKQLTVVMKLLQKSPNLSELDIMARSRWNDDKEAALRLLKDPSSCNLKMLKLNTIKIELFSGSTLGILFVKMLLSKSPALEKVCIHKSKEFDESMDVKIQSELLRFPRASPNAQIVWTDFTGCRLELFVYPGI